MPNTTSPTGLLGSTDLRAARRLSIAIVIAAAAACHWPCNVAAQGVTVAGTFDVMLRADSGMNGGGVIKSLAPGNASASRLRFMALEELGDGLSAAMIIEGGFNPDDGSGANNAPGVSAGAFTFGRLSFVQLGSDRTGYVAFGRQYTPIGALSASGAYDPFGAGFLGGIVNLDTLTIRASNSIVYHYGYTWEGMRKPAPSTGLGAVVMLALGEAAPPAASRAGRQGGLNLTYGTERWWAGYAYHRMDGNSAATSATASVSDRPKLEQHTVGLSYVIGNTRLNLGVNLGKNDAAGAAALDRQNVHIGFTTDFTPSIWVAALYGKADDRTAADRDFTTLQIGGGYRMSKRTMLYAVVGQGDNNARSAYFIPGALGTYAPGATSRSAVLGMRHFF